MVYGATSRYCLTSSYSKPSNTRIPPSSEEKEKISNPWSFLTITQINLSYYCVINYVMCVGFPTQFEPLCLWMLRVRWVISPRRKSHENWQHSLPPPLHKLFKGERAGSMDPRHKHSRASWGWGSNLPVTTHLPATEMLRHPRKTLVFNNRAHFKHVKVFSLK